MPGQIEVRSGPLPRPAHNTKGLYSYPDLVVICGEPKHLDIYRDVIVNPKAIIEVLSPMTEDFYRRVKFARYRMWNDTLTDYLLISQHLPFVEHFERREDGVDLSLVLGAWAGSSDQIHRMRAVNDRYL